MLSEKTTEALSEILAESLEKLALPATETAELPAQNPVNPLCASLRFGGAHPGRIELVVPRAFTRILSDRLPDLKAPIDSDRADESLKELVSTVATAMVPHLMNGDRRPVDLSKPTLHSVDTELDWPNLATSRGTHLFNTLGHIVAARIVELD